MYNFGCRACVTDKPLSMQASHEEYSSALNHPSRIQTLILAYTRAHARSCRTRIPFRPQDIGHSNDSNGMKKHEKNGEVLESRRQGQCHSCLVLWRWKRYDPASHKVRVRHLKVGNQVRPNISPRFTMVSWCHVTRGQHRSCVSDLNISHQYNHFQTSWDVRAVVSD